jgi:hypothetical protein
MLAVLLFTIRTSASQPCDGRYQLMNKSSYTIQAFQLYSRDGSSLGPDLLLGIPLGPNSRWIRLESQGVANFRISLAGNKMLQGTINNLCANERGIVVLQDRFTNRLLWDLQ